MSALDLQSFNPYESPQAEGQGQIVVASSAKYGVTGRLIRRAMLYRQIHLSGRVEAVLEWNGRWPREVVRIDGQVAAARHAFWYAPKFEFEIQTVNGPSEITVEVRVNVLVSWVTAFRVKVDGAEVYCESAGRRRTGWQPL